MEYILISDSKLKVMLEREDLEEWDMSAERLDYSDPEAKRVFGDILCYAKRELGFDTEGRRVLLQLFPSKDGGCELFITCMGRSGNSLAPQKITVADKKATLTQRAYSFEALEDLIGACKRLVGIADISDSCAWFDPDGRWYLTFNDTRSDEDFEFFPLNSLSFICEYGEGCSAKALSMYLGENAQAACRGDAIERLGRL